MKLKQATLLALLPGLSLADFVDFGTLTKSLDAEQATELSLAADSGFSITEVFPDTPAAKLGLKKGDIVTALNGKPVFSTTTLAKLIAGTQSKGAEISLSWNHAGETKTGSVVLDASATKAEFSQRYEAKPQIRSFVVGGPNGVSGDDLSESIKEAMEKALGKSGLSGDVLKQVQDQLNGTAAPNSMLSFNISKKMTIKSDKGTVSLDAKNAEGKFPIVITDTDGEEVFKKTIGPDEIDQVPAEWQEHVKSAMERAASIQIGENKGIEEDSEKKAKQDTNLEDLLKKLEEREAKGE